MIKPFWYWRLMWLTSHQIGGRLVSLSRIHLTVTDFTTPRVHLTSDVFDSVILGGKMKKATGSGNSIPEKIKLEKSLEDTVFRAQLHYSYHWFFAHLNCLKANVRPSAVRQALLGGSFVGGHKKWERWNVREFWDFGGPMFCRCL